MTYTLTSTKDAQDKRESSNLFGAADCHTAAPSLPRLPSDIFLWIVSSADGVSLANGPITPE
jgi:hypothetical protein